MATTYKTSKIDTIVPNIKEEAKDLELIKLEPGKKPEKKSYSLLFFNGDRIKVLKKRGKKKDYYIFPNKIQFQRFCEKIGKEDYFFTKKINDIPVYFLTEFLGVDEYETRGIFSNYKNILYILGYLKKKLGYDLDYHKTIFSKAIYDAQKRNLKKYKFKNEIDSFFGFFNNNAYKDVFVFKETRKNRKIYVLDINSMYPFLLTLKRYPVPYKMKKIRVSSIKELEKYPFFAIKASVKVKKEISEEDKIFIKNFHAIECRINNYTVPVELSEENSLCTYFFKEEYEFYKDFLDFTLEDEFAIVCDEIGESSLVPIVKETYPKRLETKRLKKEDKRHEITDSVLKNYLVALPSAYSQNSSVVFEKYFRNEEDFKKFIEKKLAFKIREDEINTKPFSIIFKRYEKINGDYVFHVKYRAFSYRFKDNLISHHSVMFANARVLMMKYFLEMFKNREKFGLEIFYSNIDSMHVSIDAQKESEFEEFLREKEFIGEELGKLKIETKGDYGLWFDVGSYYIFDKNYQILKYANPLPKSRKRPFQIVCAIKDYDEFGYEFFRKYNLFKSFRYVKTFENPPYEDFVKFKRMPLQTGCVYENVNAEIRKNLLLNYEVYKQTFYTFKEFNFGPKCSS